MKKAKHFCFETSWLKHPEYAEKNSGIWNREVIAKNAVEKWCIKLNRVKKFLKGWGQNIKGYNRRYKNTLKSELAELEKRKEEGSLTAFMLRKKNFIQTELWRILEEEEIYWHKRSNQNWLLKGDNNTEYFHRVANGKKRKNMIFQIERGDELLQSEKDILARASQYYKTLFGHEEKPVFNLDPVCWTQEEKVTEEENEALTRHFSLEELKKAIFFSVQINGSVGSYFKSGKGVRQGYPLSPLLFNLAADCLAKMVCKAQENGLIKGLVQNYIEHGVAILQYADDTILCIEDEME
jgi:hypothetical protein